MLQAGQFERVGGSETISTDVRIISATNFHLQERIAKQQFREDLFYRVNVVTIELPPLRSRREDIPALAEHAVRRLARKNHWPQLALSAEAVERLCEWSWPGNVRELQNVLAHAAILSRGRLITPDDLILAPAAVDNKNHDVPQQSSLTLKEILAATERRVIAEALEQAGWSRTRAAQLLGVSRRQLYDKIQQYDLHRDKAE